MRGGGGVIARHGVGWGTMKNVSKLTPAQVKLLARADLTLARKAFEGAAAQSRAWDKLVSDSIAKHGDRPQGGFVSGIYSEHFPKETQETLRDLAKGVSVYSDNAYSLRPRGVRMSTMRNLRLAVIARDGSGYYG